MNPRAGQIWAYDSQANTLPLVVESESKDMPEAPDDFTLGPDERLYLYQDGSGGDNIVGVNSRGELMGDNHDSRGIRGAPNCASRRQWIARLFAAYLYLAPRAARPADAIAAVDAVARVGDTNLVLNGAGLRKMFMTDVYVIGIYLAEHKKSAEAIFSAPGPKRISLRFVREVTAMALVQALYEGLRDNTSEREFANLKSAADMLSAMILPFKVARKGDVVALDYLPASGSHVVVNGRRSEKGVPGGDLYAALLRIWIGENPVDMNLKRALLGA